MRSSHTYTRTDREDKFAFKRMFKQVHAAVCCCPVRFLYLAARRRRQQCHNKAHDDIQKLPLANDVQIRWIFFCECAHVCLQLCAKLLLLPLFTLGVLHLRCGKNWMLRGYINNSTLYIFYVHTTTICFCIEVYI